MSKHNRNQRFEEPVRLSREHGRVDGLTPAESAALAEATTKALTPEVDVTIEEESDLLEAFALRVEKRAGDEGPQWRCITVQLMPDGSVKEKASPWRERAKFYADLALTRAPFNAFVFDGVGRPTL